MLDQKKLSAEEKLKVSQTIEKLLTNDLHGTISFYTNKYDKILEKKLGMDRDDIINDMREQIWKGLLTHDKKKAANLKTYLNNIIQNRFSTLYERTNKHKHSMIDYYADVHASADVAPEYTETHETGETFLQERQLQSSVIQKLDDRERAVYANLLLGHGLSTIMEKCAVTDIEAKRAINKIAGLVSEARKGEEHGA